MAPLTFDKQLTAVLVIDPYNDFISEGGKIWGRLKTVAEANDCVPNMLQVVNAGASVARNDIHRTVNNAFGSWTPRLALRMRPPLAAPDTSLRSGARRGHS